MSDKIIDSIKNGKGLPPLNGGGSSSQKQNGIATENRTKTRKGLTIETAELKKK